MLSAETAVGGNPIKPLQVMARIIHASEEVVKSACCRCVPPILEDLLFSGDLEQHSL